MHDLNHLPPLQRLLQHNLPSTDIGAVWEISTTSLSPNAALRPKSAYFNPHQCGFRRILLALSVTDELKGLTTFWDTATLPRGGHQSPPDLLAGYRRFREDSFARPSRGSAEGVGTNCYPGVPA